MNIAALAMAPLRATATGTRWSALGLMVLMLVVSMALPWVLGATNAIWLAGALSGYGELFAGMLFIAPSLRLAIDARQLRIPHSHAGIVLAMSLYGVFWIALPTIALTLAGANFLTALTVHSLGLLLGLTFGLLPRVFLVATGLPPAVLNVLHISSHAPEKSVLLMLFAVIAALLLICTLCWRRQLRLDDPYRRGFNRPLAVFQAQHRDGFARNVDSMGQLRALPQWLLGVVDLRRAGPADPVASLRVALGGWIAPKTRQSIACRWLLAIVPITVIAATLFLWQPEAVRGVLQRVGVNLIIWTAGFGSTLLGLNTAVALQRWTQTRTDAALLALLPALGDGAAAKKNLLRASLLPGMRWQTVFMAVLVVTSLTAQLHGLALLMALLVQLNALVFAPAFALAYFGDRPPRPWMVGLAAGISFALIGLGISASSFLAVSAARAPAMAVAIVAAQCAVLVFFSWIGTRGGRGLRACVHPFLAR